jgi:hypothetical protein
METLGYYKVTVKVTQEQENGKSKSTKEVYIVKNAGSPQIAADRVQTEFRGCTDEWAIESVKVEKIAYILDALEE